MSIHLTSEEEDQLLAEYGSESIYDKIAGFDLPSLRARYAQAKNDLVGVSPSFLTGTLLSSTTEIDDVDGVLAAKASDPLRYDGPTVPLASVVARHTSTSDLGTSVALLVAFSAQIAVAERDAAKSTASRRRTQLKRAKDVRQLRALADNAMLRGERLQDDLIAQLGAEDAVHGAVTERSHSVFLHSYDTAEWRLLDSVLQGVSVSLETCDGDEEDACAASSPRRGGTDELLEALVLADLAELRALTQVADDVVNAPRYDPRADSELQQQLRDLDARLARQLRGEEEEEEAGASSSQKKTLADLDALDGEAIKSLIVDAEEDDGAAVLTAEDIAAIAARHNPAESKATPFLTAGDIEEIVARNAIEDARLAARNAQVAANNATRNRLAAMSIEATAASALREAAAADPSAATSTELLLAELRCKRERQHVSLLVGDAPPPDSYATVATVPASCDVDTDALMAALSSLELHHRRPRRRLPNQPTTAAGVECLTEPQGNFTLNFETMCDTILPPSLEMCVVDSTDAGLSSSAPRRSRTALPPADGASGSVASIARRTARDTFLLKHEARERRAMLTEDTAAAQLQRRSEVVLAARAAERKGVDEDEARARKGVLTLAAVAWSDLAEKGKKQSASILRWAAHKSLQQAQVAIDGAVEAEDIARRQLYQMATETEWAELVALAYSERREIGQAAEALAKAVGQAIAVLRLAAQKNFRHRCCGFAEERHASAKLVLLSASALPLVVDRERDERIDGTMLELASPANRMAALAAQLEVKQEWQQFAKADIAAAQQALSATLGHFQQQLLLHSHSAATSHSSPTATPAVSVGLQLNRKLLGHGSSSGATNGTAPTIGKKRASLTAAIRSSTPADEDDREAPVTDRQPSAALQKSIVGNALNADTVRRFHPHLFAAFQLGLQRLSGLADSITVNLEGLETIDYSSVQSLMVPGGAPLGTFVSSLDLSCNSLTAVDAAALLAALPSLRRIALSDNRLTAVLLANNASAVNPQQRTSLFTASAVLRLRLSANRIQSLNGLSQFPGLISLQIFSNCLESSLPLEHCPRLVHLEINRNNLKELLGIGRLPVLRTLDCSRNAVESLGGLSHNVLLEDLFISSNSLKDVPSRLSTVFLRTLFLNDNGLTTLPELQWLPFLAVLSLESNRLGDIHGVASCPMLVTLRVAFNQLGSMDCLLPMASCKRLASVSITDNPIACSPYTRRLCRMKFLSMLPLLKEVDNEAVSKAEQWDTRKVQFLRALQPTLALALCTPNDKIQQRLVTAKFVLPASFTRTGPVLEWLTHAAPTLRASVLFSWWHAAWRETALSTNMLGGSVVPPRTARDGLEALLQRQQQQHDWQEAVHTRALHDAEAVEDHRLRNLRRRCGIAVDSADDQQPPQRTNFASVASTASDVVFLVDQQQHLGLSLKHLQELHSTAAGSGCYTATHVLSSSYASRAIKYREEKSRKLLARWLYDRCCIRKAQNKLRALRESSVAFEQKKMESAARRIQPLWRGAWTRMRLKRARVGLDDEDDCKPLTFDVPTMPTFGNQAFASLVGAALQGTGTKMPVFSISRHALALPRLSSAPGSLPGNATGRVADPFDFPLGDARGPIVASTPSNGRPASMPTCDSVQGRLVPMSPGGTPGPRPHVKAAVLASNAVDDAWGAAVGETLRKRDKKFEKARAEQARKDYLLDPLKHQRTK